MKLRTRRHWCSQVMASPLPASLLCNRSSLAHIGDAHPLAFQRHRGLLAVAQTPAPSTNQKQTQSSRLLSGIQAVQAVLRVMWLWSHCLAQSNMQFARLAGTRFLPGRHAVWHSIAQTTQAPAQVLAASTSCCESTPEQDGSHCTGSCVARPASRVFVLVS